MNAGLMSRLEKTYQLFNTCPNTNKNKLLLHIELHENQVHAIMEFNAS